VSRGSGAFRGFLPSERSKELFGPWSERCAEILSLFNKRKPVVKREDIGFSPGAKLWYSLVQESRKPAAFYVYTRNDSPDKLRNDSNAPVFGVTQYTTYTDDEAAASGKFFQN
jgi:hypothetical protein